MPTKFQFTRFILSIFIAAALLLQPIQAQTPAKPKTMTQDQILAFLREAQKKGQQVTIKTHKGQFNGRVHILLSGEQITLADKRYSFLVGPCGAEGPGYSYKDVLLTDIVSVEKRNLPLKVLNNIGEASLTLSSSAVFLAVGFPVFAVQSALRLPK